MTAALPYNAAFFNGQKDASFDSARVVVPHVYSLCNPKSVVDFGAGVGTWLRAFLEVGVDDILGIDGDYVLDESLVVPSDRFIRANITEPVNLKRKFDLAISMEVAEHLLAIGPPSLLIRSRDTAESSCSPQLFHRRVARIM